MYFVILEGRGGELDREAAVEKPDLGEDELENHLNEAVVRLVCRCILAEGDTIRIVRED